LEYLASIKWKGAFKCSKCNHNKFTIRKLNYARDCNLCHHVESPTANTIFHKVKFGIRKAFGIVFEMSATTKSLSSSQMAKRYSISRPTAWLFMHKVRSAMKSSELNPVVGTVYVDEFVYGVTVSFSNPIMDAGTSADITITFNLNLRNVTDNFVLKIFKAWAALNYDLSDGTRGIKLDYMSDVMRIAEANRNGEVWRSFIFHHIILAEITGLDDLDYNSNEPSQLSVRFRADDWDDDLS
jgi:hypothetical protein